MRLPSIFPVLLPLYSFIVPHNIFSEDRSPLVLHPSIKTEVAQIRLFQWHMLYKVRSWRAFTGDIKFPASLSPASSLHYRNCFYNHVGVVQIAFVPCFFPAVVTPYPGIPNTGSTVLILCFPHSPNPSCI